MKRKDVIKKLRQNGWVITHGGRHDLAKHSNSNIKIPIPRHNEIDEYTARQILKDAGLE